jgi:hypothetical protein
MDMLACAQIGVIAENHVANMLMIAARGRLSAFQPVADDDGIDLLIYDKKSGRALPAQIKCRTVTINRAGKAERSDIVHFELRKATYMDRPACAIFVLLPAMQSAVVERATNENGLRGWRLSCARIGHAFTWTSTAALREWPLPSASGSRPSVGA